MPRWMKDSMCSLVKPPAASNMRILPGGKRVRESEENGGEVFSFQEGRLTDSALVVHGAVVGFIIGPAGLAEGLVLHLRDVFTVCVGLWVLGFAGFGLVLGHGALLALLAGLAWALLVGSLTTLGALLAAHEVLLLLLAKTLPAEALLAWVLWVLSVAVLVLLAVWIFVLLLLAIALFFLLAVTLFEALLIVIVLPALLAVLLLLTVLGHSFGQL